MNKEYYVDNDVLTELKRFIGNDGLNAALNDPQRITDYVPENFWMFSKEYPVACEVLQTVSFAISDVAEKIYDTSNNTMLNILDEVSTWLVDVYGILYNIVNYVR